MITCFWDASALVKRYSPEIGNETVDALFERADVEMAASLLGYAETYSVLVRKRNRGDFSTRTFRAARSAIRTEVLDRLTFQLLALDETDILAGVVLVERHNLNASDAAILASVVEYSRQSSSPSSHVVLIAADERFIKAANSEGIRTINPERIRPSELATALRA